MTAGDAWTGLAYLVWISLGCCFGVWLARRDL